MSIAAAGVGSVLLAAGLVLSLRVEAQEARRQSSGGVLPCEVQLAPGTEPRRIPEEEKAQELLEQLRAQNVDARILPAPQPEVTCAIRILRPEMTLDPGIYKQVPPSDVESKIRIVGDSPCLRLQGSAIRSPAHYGETRTLGGRAIELVRPPEPPIKR